MNTQAHHITWLRDHGACYAGLAFAKRFPTLKAAWDACEDLEHLRWVATATAERAYDEALATARRAYDEALATARRAYLEAIAPARRAYDESRGGLTRSGRTPCPAGLLLHDRLRL
jgi:hypothetical protein